jgi:glycosyltransferase involved in cell wall biosynthesis
LAQTFTDYELLISDNASVDRTAAIYGEYAVNDRGIKFVQHERHIFDYGDGERQRTYISTNEASTYIAEELQKVLGTLQ